jgi:2-methylisocitrate lyase-like PEP mutase family enzyme
MFVAFIVVISATDKDGFGPSDEIKNVAGFALSMSDRQGFEERLYLASNKRLQPLDQRCGRNRKTHKRIGVTVMTANIASVPKRNLVEKIEFFRKLHVPGMPIILYNIWDAGSAQAVAKAGAKAIATSSWAVAKAHGFEDGERLPYELALQNLRQIVEAVGLPVTFDIESAYGEKPEEVAKNISLAIRAGAVGCNFEDSVPGSGTIRDMATQVERVRAVRTASDRADVPFFINARCDLFFQGHAVKHDEDLLAMVVDRASAYAEAGADGLFVPGLATISLISHLVKESPVPVNILADSSTSLQILADSGVSRVSYGAAPYIETLNALEQAAHAIAD